MNLLKQLKSNYDKKRMSLDDYIFYIFLNLLLSISMISIIVNVIASYPLSANIKWVLGILLCVIGNLLLQKERWVEEYKTFVFSIILLFLIFPSWFYGGGDNTFTLMYLLVLGIQSLMMFRTRWRRILFIMLCIMMGVSFVVADYYFAHLIRSTQGQNVFLDSIIQIVMIFTITAISVGVYTEYYRRQNDTLEKMAYEDILSGVYNRRKIIELLESSMQENGKPFSYLLMLDIDDFKAINDQYGHLAGDDIITWLGEHLYHTLGELGYAGRYGGDEFLVLLRCDEATLYKFVQSLYDGIKEDSICYTLSGGVALVDEKKELDSLISDADCMLYVAKEHGRNRISFWNGTEVKGEPVCLV